MKPHWIHFAIFALVFAQGYTWVAGGDKIAQLEVRLNLAREDVGCVQSRLFKSEREQENLRKEIEGIFPEVAQCGQYFRNDFPYSFMYVEKIFETCLKSAKKK